MKSVIKFICVTIGLFLIGIGVAALFLSLHVNQVLHSSLEKALTHILNAEVIIDKVKVSFFEKTILINGLNIANPQGFSRGTAFRCETINVIFELRSLISSNPQIPSITCTNGYLNVRHELGKGTNIKILLDTASDRLSPHRSTISFLESFKFSVQKLRCENFVLNLDTNLVPLLSAEIPLEPFTIENLQDGHSIDLREFTGILLKSIITQAGKSALKPIREILGIEDTSPKDSSLAPIEEKLEVTP